MDIWMTSLDALLDFTVKHTAASHKLQEAATKTEFKALAFDK